jgi:K+:H+ antiporter
MEFTGFHAILILLAVAVVLVALFRFLRLPQVLAYFCAGALVGPFGLGWIPDLQETRALAEFGLVFLMFTVGLEFSLPNLLAMRRVVFGLGGAQVAITGAVFGVAAWGLGVSIEGAIVIGAMLSLSSTAIAMKQMVEQLEQTSRHGRHALGVLLFQDLAAVPFLILIPTLAGKGGESVPAALGWVALKSVLVFGVIYVVGRWLLRPLLHQVAAARLREFFMFTVLLVTLASAWLTETAGLSLALGAFLAGMMLGETEYRHQVEADILPFRDILLGLFFITIGMLLNVDDVIEYWWLVLGATLAIVVFKTALIALLGRAFGMEAGVALRTGLVLAQVGEFAFALLLQAEQYRLIGDPATQVVLAAVVISMALAPLIIRYNGWIAKRYVPGYERARRSNLQLIRDEARHAERHVIICGFGRSGQNLAWMLEREGVASLALDLDPVRVRDAREAGKQVVYGDAARRDVLEAAGLHRAAAVVVSFNAAGIALKILEITRHLRPDMPVIVRTMDDADLDRLKTAGATEVVPESLEGSLMMGSHLLMLLGVPVSRIVRHVRDVRRDRYRMMRGFFHGEDLFEEKEGEAYRERLHSVTLPHDARAAGRRIADLRLDQFGVTVSAVRRGGIRGPEPSPDTQLAAGDVLVLYGTPEALEEAKKCLMQG